MLEPEHRRLRVLLAGGGTGGHLYPALAIAQGLRELEPDCDIRFIGSRYGLEANILPEKNEVFYPLNIQGLQRRLSPIAQGRNLWFPCRLAASYLRSRKILKQFNPQVAVGTGGYASGLPIFAAQRQGIPTLIHEQNSYPGLTTRKLAAKANMVCLTYKSTTRYISTRKWILTGNPVRFTTATLSRKIARQKLNLPARKQILFILGGSQGSRPLNNHFLAKWPEYTQKMGVHLLWQTGLRDYNRVKRAVGSESSITLFSFISSMEAAYRAADLVVCRAGATTLAEITHLGQPAVLIPLPSATVDHQTSNAKQLLKKKAARLVPQAELPAGRLEQVIRQLIKYPDRLRVMGNRAQELATPEATKQILDHILKLAEA